MIQQVKVCTKCKCAKSLPDFGKKYSNPPRLMSWCKECERARQREYSTSDQGRLKLREKYKRLKLSESGQVYLKRKQRNPLTKSRQLRYRATAKGKSKRIGHQKAYAQRYPEKIKAQHAVRKMVAMGRLQKATTLLCVECCSPAKEWHHHLGYEKKHWLDVIPVCKACHTVAHSRG